MMDEDSTNDTFDYEQFLLAEQVRKYYYHGLYPVGIFVIWTLLRADCYNLSGCDSLGNPPILYASKVSKQICVRILFGILRLVPVAAAWECYFAALVAALQS
ncbi:hypothetical protein V7S43_007438 [Phytophthora oleae]|uniref:Uncharacterized protein n=1 Tax=Phytophthora oleae TaxID=2107226 RepID=A0ABD3FJW6_9STRA